MGGKKNIFLGGIFGQSSTISAAKPQMKFQNLRKCWVKIQQIGIFLIKCGSKCHIMSQKTGIEFYCKKVKKKIKSFLWKSTKNWPKLKKNFFFRVVQ
jgi:hypothetical protein